MNCCKVICGVLTTCTVIGENRINVMAIIIIIYLFIIIFILFFFRIVVMLTIIICLFVFCLLEFIILSPWSQIIISLFHFFHSAFRSRSPLGGEAGLKIAGVTSLQRAKAHQDTVQSLSIDE